MTKHAVFIAPLYDINVPESLGRGDRLDEHLFLTNDKAVITSLMSSRLVHRIGSLEKNAVCQVSKLVAYATFPLDAFPTDPAAVEDMIFVQLIKLHWFQDMLWLVKDNSASTENGFVDSPAIISSRNYSRRCSFSDGSCHNADFARQELKSARSLYRKLCGRAVDWDRAALGETAAKEVVSPEGKPLSRALFFIATARTSSQLSVKVANYCTALEALLISTPSELTYRLSQRVAWLVGETPQERLDLFQKMKRAYDIRSKAVHGGVLSGKKLRNELMATTVACDDIVRCVLRKLLATECYSSYVVGESKQEAYENAMTAITLGVPQEPPK